MPTPTPHRFLSWLACGAAAACVALQALAQFPRAEELQKVETHVGRNHWLNALRELRELKLPEEAKLNWLEIKAEEGSVPAQFELSAMLHKRDFESSLKWYARAVLGGALDAASCTQPRGYPTLLDRVEPVRSDAIEQPDLLERAIDAAMARSNAVEPTRWSGWLCEPNRRLTGEREVASRVDAMKDMAIETRSFKLFAEAVRRGRERSFVVVDTGLTLDSTWPRDKGAWIDDTHALFIATDEKTAPRRDRDEAVFAWDMKTKTHRTITPAGFSAHGVCSHRGLTTVGVTKQLADAERSRYELSGAFPDLRLAARTTPWTGRSDSMNAPPGCNLLVRPPAGLDSINVRWLEPEHGYMESIPEPRAFFAKTTLVKPDGSRIPLHDVFLTFASQPLGFASWRNAYLLRGAWDAERSSFTTRFRKRGEGAQLIWLTPDGATELETIPYGYWDQSQPPSGAYRPVRGGIIGAGHRYERDDQAGFSGLFIFEPKRVTRLLAGIVEILDVTPNGCRIAVTHRQVPSQRTSQAKIVDLCGDRE